MKNTNGKPPEEVKAAISHLVEAAGAEGEPDSYAGKRLSTRFADGMRLEVSLDPKSPKGSWAVFMHNVSDGGFAFWSKQKLPARTPLYVREFSDDESAAWVGATVQHCSTGIRGFLVGAAFDRPATVNAAR